jgi:putative addiction module killer protein
VYEVRNYVTSGGRDVFAEWRNRLRHPIAKAAIVRRINRVEEGNFGDHKYLKDGVSELRLNLGPGYRIYYALAGTQVVLLLCGGDKGTQTADIDRACEYWKEWQSRPKENQHGI